MRTLRVALLFALAATAFSLARAEDNEATKKDLEHFQGEWSMVSGTADGQPMGPEMLRHFKGVCKGDELTVTLGQQVIIKAKVAIDPSKAPKTIDYDVSDGPNKGKKLMGIYEFDGDTLKFCFAAPGDERPKDFTSKAGDKRTS